MQEPLIVQEKLAQSEYYDNLRQSKDYMKSANFLYTTITPLIDEINKSEKQLQNSDLQCYLEEELDPRRCINTTMKILDQAREKGHTHRTPTFQIYKLFFLGTFCKCGLVNLFQKFLLIGLVLNLDQTTSAIQNFGKGEVEKAEPLLYLLLMGICYFLNSYVDSRYKNMMNIFLSKLRIVSQFLIYQKALRTKLMTENQEEQQKDTPQEGDEEDNKKKKPEDKATSSIFNLMTVDVQQILAMEYGAYECILLISIKVVSSLGLVIAGLAFLYARLGNIVLDGIYVIIGSCFYNIFVSFGIIFFYKKILQHKDKRVELTSDVVEGIKQIKYLSWEEIFRKKILEHRRREFYMIIINKIFDGFCAIFWNCISYILMYFFLVRFVNEGNALGSTNVFTLITIFNMITFPLGVLPWTLNNTILTLISYNRIQRYLNETEIEEYGELRLNSNLYKQVGEQQPVLLMSQIAFKWPTKLKKQKKDKIKIQEAEEFVPDFKLFIKDFQIKKNTLNFMVGRIAQGKSALFNAILNELDKLKEKISDNRASLTLAQSISGDNLHLSTIVGGQQFFVCGEIAYVSQTSWLQNETIRNNILFGKPMDSQLYRECLDACELVYDLNTFDKRDLYELGPEAKNISGGQKQRIALCRALYQDKDIYLLDDVFSSLDVHVADAIYEKAIINFLIKRQKTVIFITSHFRFLLKSAIRPDQVFMLEGGVLVDDQKLIEQFIQTEGQKEEEEEQEKERQAKQKKIIDAPSLKKQTSSYNKALESAINSSDNQDELNQEERKEGEIDWGTLKTYFSSMSWFFFTTVLVTNFLMQGCRSLIDFWLKSQVTEGSNEFQFLNDYFGSFQQTFTALIILLLIVTSVRSGAYVFCNVLSAKRLFERLNTSIMKSKMKFFDTNNEGRVINRISNDTFEIDNELPWFCHVFLENLAESVGFPVGIIIMFPWVGAILAVELYLIYLVQRVYRKANRDLKRINSTNEGRVLGFLSETLAGVKVIRAFAKQRFFIDGYAERMTDSTISRVMGTSCLNWLGIRLMLLSNFVFVSVAITITICIIFDIDIEYSTCALTLTYSVIMLNSFTEVVKFFSGVEQRMVSVERVKQYYDNPLEDIDEKEQSVQNIEPEVIKQLLGEFHPEPTLQQIQEHALIFDNVCLTYESGDDATKLKFALKKFSLFIRRGEKIAFVGRTGSGKTSIINILFRLYNFQHGRIFINGVDTDHCSLKELRQQMSVVPQFGFLYKATLRENLDPTGEVSESEMKELFSRTGFTIKGAMKNDQIDLDFQISKGGSNLSNGEKQVINFFRIILQNRQIVCLDEATSNMDPKTDEELHRLLFDYARDRTLLVITHRLENISLFDRIVVMDKGEIKEAGTYQELIQNQNGFFYNLLVNN